MAEAIKDVKLEKGMYDEVAKQRKSFNALLEEQDPSGEYQGELGKLTAYERQLVKHDIRVKGLYADVVEKFFATTSSTVLFPDYVTGQVQAGILAASLLPQITAVTTDIGAATYKGLVMAETEADRQLHQIGEGTEIPVTSLSTTEHTVNLHKYGRRLEVTYEALKRQRIDVVAVFLQRMGVQIGLDETDAALGVIINGDGNSNPLVDTDSEVTTVLDYDEMTRLYLAFTAGYGLNTIVVGDPMLRTILNMNEFKDPDVGFSFQRTGQLMSPVGATMLRWTSTAVLPTDYVLGIDSRFGLQQLTDGGVTTEVDRIISRQTEQTVVSKWTGFVKLDTAAFNAIDVTHA